MRSNEKQMANKSVTSTESSTLSTVLKVGAGVGVVVLGGMLYWGYRQDCAIKEEKAKQRKLKANAKKPDAKVVAEVKVVEEKPASSTKPPAAAAPAAKSTVPLVDVAVATKTTTTTTPAAKVPLTAAVAAAAEAYVSTSAKVEEIPSLPKGFDMVAGKLSLIKVFIQLVGEASSVIKTLAQKESEVDPSSFFLFILHGLVIRQARNSDSSLMLFLFLSLLHVLRKHTHRSNAPSPR